MNQFKDYLVQEYREKAKGFVAVETKFSHTFNIKTDAKSGVVQRNNYIKVSLKFVDKELNPLFNASIVFENNMIPKRLHKSFINISPKELENKFNVAKNEIRDLIASDYLCKKKELDDKLANLTKYLGTPRTNIIPTQFSGESIQIVDSNENTKKTSFDM